MKTTDTQPTPRKTLRQSLKDLFRRTTTSRDVGSGILKADNNVSFPLPQFSAVSLFPDFGASDWDIAHYASLNQAQYHLPQVAPLRPHDSRKSLLPRTSLSQFGLSQTFARQGEITPQRVVSRTVPEDYFAGLSQQASLASLAPSAVRRSTSTLKIRPSKRDLTAATATSNKPQQSRAPRLRTKDSVVLTTTRPSPPTRSSTPGRTSISSSHSKRHSKLPFTLVEHFRSFCVLDTAQPGYPVSACSENLRYVFQTGEKFLLNNVQVEGTSMDIVVGTDAMGNAVTHLVLFSPLLAPSSGRARFILAALVDVTPFVKEAASLPDLDAISEEGSMSSLADVVATPPAHRSPGWKPLNYELSCEDLLGGCCLDDRVPPKYDDSDIWLDLASSERAKMTQKRMKVREPGTPTSISSRSVSSSVVDDVLEEFVTQLQSLHSQFFLLGKSALDDSSYEICNVSGTLFEAKDFVDGHLSCTSRDVMAELSTNLSYETPFTMRVRWGVRGELKQLYCSPLYGQRSLTWLCFLVEPKLPVLW
jgi:hypothetical protein